VVVSAVNTDVEQKTATSDFIRTQHRLSLPSPKLVTVFNPGWYPRESGVAVTIDDESGEFSFFHADTKGKLDDLAKSVCAGHSSCREIGRVMNGCIALFKSVKSQFFIGKSVKMNGSSHDDLRSNAKNQAMKACESSDGAACELVRSDCAF
jgi:hypothetical protein